MNAIEKLKLTKELRTLITQIAKQKGVGKLKSAKRIRELVALLGGQIKNIVNQLYQSIMDGTAVTVELIEQVMDEAKKDLMHPQLRPAIMKIRDQLTAA